MKTSTAESERGIVTHFRVTAREMLFDQPECCPIYGGLSFDGLAIDENDGVHLGQYPQLVLDDVPACVQFAEQRSCDVVGEVVEAEG
jgi:hypothetical protein